MEVRRRFWTSSRALSGEIVRLIFQMEQKEEQQEQQEQQEHQQHQQHQKVAKEITSRH